MIEHDRAAGFQTDFARECRLDLMLDLEAGKQRCLVLVQLQPVQVLRHHLLHELECAFVNLGIVDQDLADVLAQVIADRADHEIAFLVDQKRSGALLGRRADRIPEMNQVIEVPLELFGALSDARGPYDDGVILGDLKLRHGLPHLGALLPLDAARDASALGIVRHEDEIASGQTDERGEGRTLAAAFLFFHLDDQFLAFLDHILDAHLRHRGLVVVIPEIYAGYFLEWQESLAFGSIIHKGSLEAGLDARHLPFVDIALLLLIGGGFDIEVEELLAVDDGYAQLFRVSCVKQHSFHLSKISRRPAHCTAPADDHLEPMKQ